VSSDGHRGIEAFWDWWARHCDGIASAISAGTIASWVPEITSVVRAIDSGLLWEVAPASRATHALIVTAEGQAELFGVVDDWLTNAPSGDTTWEFHAGRPPGPLDTLVVEGLAFGLGNVRAQWTRDDGRERLDLELWHPAWINATPRALGLSSQLFLDRLLGEIDKERWIGSVETVDSAREGADPGALRAAVEMLADTATKQKWTTTQRRSLDGRATLLTMNEALKRIDHPRASWHLIVSVDRDPGTAQGPRSITADDVVAIMESLDATLAAVVADAQRSIFHFVVDPSLGAIAAALAWARRIRGAHVTATADPAWRFRGDLILGG